MIQKYFKLAFLQVLIGDLSNSRKKYNNYQDKLMKKINMLIKNLKYWIFVCKKVVRFYRMLLHFEKEFRNRLRFRIKILIQLD